MTLPKQRKDESDADYAARLEAAVEAKRERNRKHYEANREAINERHRNYHAANREAILEQQRKYREANKEAIAEYNRKRRRLPEVKARRNETARQRYEAQVLVNAKGKPLRSNYIRAGRPKMLTMLILREAENFCLEYGFDVEQKLDTDVLRHAARRVRDSIDLNGERNPWYCTEYLHESMITSGNWACSIRFRYRKRV